LFHFITTPVHPHLRAKDAVEEEGEDKTGCEEGVTDLRGGGKETGKAACDLGDDCKCGELAC